MPVPVNTGEVVQTLIQWSIEGQECENVLYFQAQAPDPDMLANLLAAIAQCLVTVLIPKLGSNFTLERIKGRVVSPAVGGEAVWIPDNSVNTIGGEAGSPLPSYCSALISLKTGFAGRSGHGRMYIGGISENDTNMSKINTEGSLWHALIAFCACMLGKFVIKDVPAGGDYTWGVMSRKLGGQKPPFAAAGYHVILDAHPNAYLATTRSRKVGRGR